MAEKIKREENDVNLKVRKFLKKDFTKSEKIEMGESDKDLIKILALNEW